MRIWANDESVGHASLIPDKTNFLHMHEALINHLKGLGRFYYYPNPGNLGDLLIAEATRQFFRRHGIDFQEYDESLLPERYCLVFGGGGRLVPLWSPDQEELAEFFTNPRIVECVILPHSIRGLDLLMARLDQRHHLYCRDQQTFEYCKKAAPHCHCYLSDDMAFEFRAEELPETQLSSITPTSEEELRMAQLIKRGFFRKMRAGVCRASATMQRQGKRCRVAFLLRHDAEKAVRYHSSGSFDLSAVIPYTKARQMAYNAEILRQFSAALKQADIIVSDRLHVCIMAFLSGLEVYMLDNSYGKLSGVYRLSMSDDPRVHLLAHAELTPELRAAWDRLNAPGRVLIRRCQTALFSALKRCRTVLGQWRRALCGRGLHF